MIENKRFERVYGDIEVVCIDHDSIGEDRFFDDGDYDKFVKSLNELHEENIRIKKEFDSCSHNWALMYDEAKNKVEALTKENWELEQENEKLENRLWNCQNVR